MTSRYAEALEALNKILEQVPNHGMTHARELMKDYQVVKDIIQRAEQSESVDTTLYDIGSLSPEHLAIYGQVAPNALIAAKTWARGDEQYNAAKIGAHRAIVHLIKRGLLKGASDGDANG